RGPPGPDRAERVAAKRVGHRADDDDGHVGIVANIRRTRRLEVPRHTAFHDAVWDAGDDRRGRIDNRHGLTAHRAVRATVRGPPGPGRAERVAAKRVGHRADDDDGHVGVVANIRRARRLEVPRHTAFHDAVWDAGDDRRGRIDNRHGL